MPLLIARPQPLVAMVLLSLVPLASAATAGPVTRGDEAWSRRAEGHAGARAAAGPIAAAIAAYGEALAADPRDPEARWKLMRALYFQGEHALADRDEKLAAFRRGRDLGDEGRAMMLEQAGLDPEEERSLAPRQLAEALADRPGAAPVTFWSAVHWGLWGRTRGKLAAAREGVAKVVRDLAETTILLDEELENGGGHRVLGRLHHEAPRLPFVTGWVDRDAAVEHLERALEIAPDDLLTRLYVVEALLEHRRERRDGALAMLRDLVGRDPHPDFVVEGEKALEDARALLARQ